MRWSCTRCFSLLQPKPAGNLQPTNTIDNHRETILLYRALLRQCTYLPDPAARNYMRSHIVERFRAYQPLARGEDGRLIRQKIKKQEPLKALKGARKDLKYLQRANDGHILHLERVLDLTYGRVGKRCRLLMAKLQAPASPLDPRPSTASPAGPAPEPLKPERKVPRLTDELEALLKSQARQDSLRFQGANVKTLRPNVPAVNSWGRPFPQNRRANFIRKWYADAMARLMPPLPAPEWERLRALASEEIRWEGPVPRRKLGTTDAVPEAGESFAAPLPPHVHIPHRLTSSTARIVERGRHADTRTNPHELTPRLMRGLWCRVFQKCPRLDWSDERGKWLVTWGRMGKGADLVFDAGKAMPDGMFEGVDDQGKVLKDVDP
ncbi:MAG: hypothetical protein Q9193_005082 [Seirophora villosa]